MLRTLEMEPRLTIRCLRNRSTNLVAKRDQLTTDLRASVLRQGCRSIPAETTTTAAASRTCGGCRRIQLPAELGDQLVLQAPAEWIDLRRAAVQLRPDSATQLFQHVAEAVDVAAADPGERFAFQQAVHASVVEDRRQ